MTSELSFGIVVLFLLIIHASFIFIGLRNKKNGKWPFSEETTIALGILLLMQTLFLWAAVFRQDTEAEKRAVGNLALPGLFLVPAVFEIVWGWIYLKFNKKLD